MYETDKISSTPDTGYWKGPRENFLAGVFAKSVCESFKEKIKLAYYTVSAVEKN